MSARPHNSIPWPTPQDYNEALQNPRLNFQDKELQSGTPDITALGLPRAITGGFASVYSVRSGSRRWAVRCFLREFSDHQARYAAIGRHLAAAQLPYTVGFQFLEQGIRVRGHWYPVLKMEWIEGSTFQTALEANVQNSIALVELAERWIKMLAALRKHSIAHGDLQHGNVLIAGGDFRLIDYDGMFVPSLTGSISHEVGHRNYQHPNRTEHDFGPHLDNFSGWAIYLTLMAVSIDSSLWGRFGGGEEHLLFRREDFGEPRYSRLFRSLQHLKDDRIQRYLPLFRSYLGMKLSSIASPADVVGVGKVRREHQRVQVPGWSKDSQLALFNTKTAPELNPSRSESVVSIAVADEPITNTDSAGSFLKAPIVLESTDLAEREPLEKIPFAPPVNGERVLLSSYTGFMVMLVGFITRGHLPAVEGIFLLVTGLGCAAACLGFSYVSLEQVRAKAVLWLFLELRRSRCKGASYAVSHGVDWIPRLELNQSQRLRRLGAKETDYVRRERARIAEVKCTLASWIDELNLRRSDLNRAEAAEEARILQELRARHEQSIKEGQFLSLIQTDRLDERDLKKVQAWRKRLDELTQAGPPKALSSAERSKIRKRYDLERRSVRRSEIFARAAAGRKILKIQQKCKRRLEQSEIKRATVRCRFERRKQHVQRVIEVSLNWLSREQLEVVQRVREIRCYRNVRFHRYLLRIMGMGMS